MTIFGNCRLFSAQLLTSTGLGWLIADSGLTHDHGSEAVKIITCSASLLIGQVLWYMLLVGMQFIPIRIVVASMIGIPSGVLIAFVFFYLLTFFP